MKKLLLLILCLVIITSCSHDDESLSLKDNSNESNKDIQVTKDGYLHFSNSNAFSDYINSIGDINGVSTKSTSVTHINGFTSLKDLKKKIESISTRSNDSQDEEGSEDEYNLSKSQDLLKDNRLQSVLDTTLRISIQDKYYKISKYGTFVTDKNNFSKIDDIITSFDKNQLSEISDGYYKINDNIFIYDSFGYISGDSCITTLNPETNITATRSSFGNIDQNTSIYNLNTYNWENKTVLGKALSFLFGKDISRDNEFDSKHRISCELFQVNYLFYASTGFKVKMQKRKKIWFIKYWVEEDADDIAIGIERLSGKMNFNYNPGSIVNYGTFTSAWQGQINNMVYSGMGKPTFLEDFVEDEVQTYFVGIKNFTLFNKWNIDPWAWTNNLTHDQIYSALNSLTGKYIAKPIQKKIAVEDPKVAYIFGKRGELEEHITGFKTYGAGSSKVIRFSQSAGITINLGHSVTGYIPEKFSINEAKVFGAVKYNGQWRGIRFVQQ